MSDPIRIVIFGCSAGYVSREIDGLPTERIGDDGDCRAPLFAQRRVASDADLANVSCLVTDDLDFGVIGNNLGAGLIRARRVPECLRDRFVIVWNERPGEFEEDYAALGYKHFCARSELMQKLQELWTAKQVVRAAEK